jgi:copper oxidase (laccase) domain-containing protein
MNSNEVTVAVSSVHDGSMSKSADDATRYSNRKKFLATKGIAPEQTILVGLVYEGDDYRRYHTVSSRQSGDGMVRPSTMTADALFTSDANVALFLPIADCIGAVLFDPIHHALGLTHLGRHNLLQHGAGASVEYMVRQFGSAASDIRVWLSPAAGPSNYPLRDFDGRGLYDVALEQLRTAGIRSRNIDIDDRDTTTQDDLYSHSAFLKGNRPEDGRQAVVAMMRS